MRHLFQWSRWFQRFQSAAPIAVQRQVLTRGQTRALSSRRDSYLVKVDSGTLWLTRAGDWHDHVLHRGEALRLTGSVRVVVEALEDASFCLLE